MQIWNELNIAETAQESKKNVAVSLYYTIS